MLVIFLYMEVLLFSNQKVPYKACKVSKPTSYKNAQQQNQLRCWSTEVPVLFVAINVFAPNAPNMGTFGQKYNLISFVGVMFEEDSTISFLSLCEFCSLTR